MTSSEAQGFYRRYGKRLCDVAGSAVGLVCLSPLLAAVYLAVMFSSRGGALFRQERVGRDGKSFRILKFRSMVAGADRMGPSITSSSDPRITPAGALLRRWKLDEFPQLWNVLKGDMSLVGPRPELPLYVRNYTPEQRQVLAVRPGITDPASLAYRDEELILEKTTDRERFYRETVLPHKLALNLEYIRNLSFARDVGLILRTLKVLPAKPFGEITAGTKQQGDKSSSWL